jgi:hypothetical protein
MHGGIIALHDIVDPHGDDLPIDNEDCGKGPATPFTVVFGETHRFPQECFMLRHLASCLT